MKIKGLLLYIRLAAAILTLPGCAMTGGESWESRATHAIYDPLQRFAVEQPVNCRSSDLYQSADMARRLAHAFTTLEYRHWAGSQLLAVADTAKRHGCLDFADSVYREIVGTFTGSGYTSLRELARIGIDDVRAARR